MTTEMLKKGYLLCPKALFEEQMNMKTGEKAADAFEAFVFVPVSYTHLDVYKRQVLHGHFQGYLYCHRARVGIEYLLHGRRDKR